jgi:capsular exopolysaccharide synthesis family protein
MEPRESLEELDFQKYWLVFKRRWLPATGVFILTTTLAVLYASSLKEVFKAEGRLLFKQNQTANLTGVGDSGLGDLRPVYNESNPLDTQAEILRSLSIAESVVTRLNPKDDQGNPISANRIVSKLEVAGIKGTDVLSISYESGNPKLAADIVNEVMKAFIQDNIDANRQEAAAARKFIAEQLPKTEVAVSRAEEALRQFKEQNQVTVLAEEATASVESIANLDRQIAEAQAQMAATVAQADVLRDRIGMSSAEAVDASTLSLAPGVQEVLIDLQEAQNQLAIERARYTDRHPAIANLNRQESGLQSLLQERVADVLGSSEQVPAGNLQVGRLKQDLTANLVELESQRLGLEQRLASLADARGAYEARASAFPLLEKTQRELERELKAAQSTYESLLLRMQEIQVAENQNVGNVRLIEEAIEPKSPSNSRNKSLTIAAGMFCGLLLAVATAFLLDLIDRSIKTVKEAKDVFGYTLLGIIPDFGILGKAAPRSRDSERLYAGVVVRDFPRSSIAKAYQMLQANLRFLNSDRELRTFVITSSIPKEGKTDVSANLAATISQVGRRVLLIDADMRQPSQHHVWDLTNSVGLSNVIVGQIEFSEAVQPVMPNLDVLTAGVIPPNPLALLDSERMASLVRMFAEQYDFVIFDTPPLAGNADAVILGKMVDGILHIVRPGAVDMPNAKAAREFLERSTQNVLGIVANGVKLRNEPDSYFHYTREQEWQEVVEQVPSLSNPALPESSRNPG